MPAPVRKLVLRVPRIVLHSVGKRGPKVEHCQGAYLPKTPRRMSPHRLGRHEAPNTLLQPVERIAINRQILSRLRAFLDQEHLKVGSKLPSERQLAAMLNVSRPSLREVLRAFSLLGIIKPKQGDGTYLAASLRKVLSHPDWIFTLQESLDLAQVAEARLAIEPHVASLAASRASVKDLRSIANELDGMRRNLKDRAEFLRHDLQFHLLLMKACGNQVLKRMMTVVLEALFDHARQVTQHYGELARILALHEEIFEALRRHDPPRARAAMVRHMRVSRRESARLAAEA